MGWREVGRGIGYALSAKQSMHMRMSCSPAPAAVTCNAYQCAEAFGVGVHSQHMSKLGREVVLRRLTLARTIST